MAQNKTTQSNQTEWHLIDAKDKVLGRIATKAASLLLGKHDPKSTAHMVAPVYVVITNTDHVALTGNKEEAKKYTHHTGWPGGLRQRTVKEQRKRDSRRIVSEAIFGMLPKNSLRAKRMQHLKLYAGSEHPHAPQFNS